MELSEIEFKNPVTERDILKFYQQKMFRSKWFYTYFVLLFTVPLIALLTIEPFKNKISLENYIGLMFIAAIISFCCFADKGRYKYILFYRPLNDKTLFVNDAGYGTRRDGEEILFKWKMVTSIEETDKYILFHIRKKNRIFFKKSLSDEVISKLVDILSQVPVKSKTILS